MNAESSACNRCESPLELGDLRCAICGEATPATLSPAERHSTLRVRILRCEGCGAAISYDAASQSPRCGFCDSKLELEDIVDPIEQTGLHLPFAASSDDARLAMRKWLGSLGWFRPSDLRTDARLESVRPLYWVAWVFDAKASISWTADSNAGARRSSWAPHAGQVGMVFDDILVSASRGLTDDEAYHLAGSYDLATRRDGAVAPEDTRSGTLIEQFDIQRSQARTRILRSIDKLAAHRVERDHVPGSRFRKIKTAALLRELITRRVALPAYVLAYRYHDKVFRVVVSGQDSACIRGSAPYSMAKILLVVLLVGVFVTAVIAAVVAAQ